VADSSTKPKGRVEPGFDTVTLETLLGGVASLLIFLILVCILFLVLLRRRKSKAAPAADAESNPTSSGGELSVYISGHGVPNSRRPQLN